MKKFFRSITRVFKGGTVKAIRLYYLTIPLILFFSLVMVVAGFSSFGYTLSKHITNIFENRINMVVYFDRNVDDATLTQITENINGRPDVEKTVLHTSAEALEIFKQRHETETTIMQSLSEIGTNPFGASLVVYAKDTSGYELLASDINALNENYKSGNLLPIEEINYEEHKIAVDRFAGMLKKIDALAYFLFVMLSLILLFTLYLALRFATQGDREEIKVMKLVGAPNILILGPTAVMAGLCGFVGAIISLILLYFAADYLSAYTMVFDGFNLLSWYIANIYNFIFGLIAFGVLFGMLGSVLAIKRHL